VAAAPAAGIDNLQIAALQENRAGTFYFVESAVDVTGLQLNAADDQIRTQPELAGVDRTVFDAVVQAKPIR
jgi:hypothetical protein